MKPSIFLLLTIVMALAGLTIWVGLQFQCGMGPDSPEACNSAADRQSTIFAIMALVAYLGFALKFGPRGPRKDR